MARLSEMQRRILSVGSFCGPRPGSNAWPLVEFEHPDGPIGGEIIDDLIRRGLFIGTPKSEPVILHPDKDDLADFEVDCAFDYDLSPRGRAALEQKP